jgi:hypothetical protein
MRKGPRFKHYGVTTTTPEGRIVLTIEPDKWTPEHAAIVKRANDLIMELFKVGSRG